MRYEYDFDRRPKSRGRLSQLNKRNRKLRRESEAVALWKQLDPLPDRRVFGLR